ncbi:rhodanese-like domain-containing protein [Dawidia soli]|uniref:Rhodanese-like domain-containing protein n=1 Tax=Dawidia soli TaxID=2782352 RepID=A0AAP2GJV9_9BACT|nr:rhodanese-like domain-containing protein [Dawidia soli]MBT1689796.1 rhodanese-like domain-containing protein [Dawidia soli]
MKIHSLLYPIPLLAAIAISLAFLPGHNEPWTADQLLAPSDLAHTLQTSDAVQPVIYSVGPGAVIKGSIDIGPTQQKENLKKLEEKLGSLPKDSPIVIYCGCCPFNKCPNIRPAFTLLNDMGFKNHKLLNLSQNVKTNWIDQGYPVNE